VRTKVGEDVSKRHMQNSSSWLKVHYASITQHVPLGLVP